MREKAGEQIRMKLLLRFFVVSFAAGLLAGPAAAAIETDGALDQAFAAGPFTNGLVNAAVLQQDGKLIIGGVFSKVHGVTRQSIARLNTDGTLDLSFDPGSGPDLGLSGLILQPDGKIIIYGLFGAVSGTSRVASIARLNNDGSLDAAFDPGSSIFGGFVYSVVLQPDGKVVVAGQFSQINTAAGTVIRAGVARFNNDGTFDPAYNSGIGALSEGSPYGVVIYHVARQAIGANNGKIVLEGQFDSFDGNPVPGLVRLNSTGSFDDSFNPGTAMDDPYSVSGLFVQANDQIAVFGNFISFNGVACSGIVRLNDSGEVDTGFNTDAFAEYGAPSTIFAVAQQPNGKLIVGGSFHSLGAVAANNVVRLEINGAKDPSFDATVAGDPSAGGVDALVVRPSDGKIFLGGYFSTYNGAPRNNVAWINNDGSLDASFAGLSGATDADPQVYVLATQPDGKIIVGGVFTSFSGTSHYNIVRLNPDSTLDPSFDSALGTDGSLRAISIQADGKILIAGYLHAVNSVPRERIARLNPDGTLDTSFIPGIGPDGAIRVIAQDAEGNIYVGGSFLHFNGLSRSRVAKLNPSGGLDPAFVSGVAGVVYAIAAPDGIGGIVVGGSFLSRRIARLSTTTGSIDTAFNSGGTGFNGTVLSLLRASDGKYYAGGTFSTFNGTARSKVGRLNANGSLDTTFAGPTLDGDVYALALQNGKVFGAENSFNHSPGKVVRFTSNGASDATFTIGTGAELSPPNVYPENPNYPAISALAIQPDGKLLLGGIFNQYNGTSRVCLARLTDSKLNFTAVSRKIHGAGGPAFDINLPLTGAPGIECRSGGANGDYQVVLNFGGPVNLGSAAVTSGAGTVTGATGSGTSTLTVNLTGITSAQRITLTLSNVSTGFSTTDLAVPIGFLVGDTNGDGTVNAGDAQQTRNRSGQAADATNFRSDVNADGFVNSGDTTAVRSRSGTSLP